MGSVDGFIRGHQWVQNRGYIGSLKGISGLTTEERGPMDSIQRTKRVDSSHRNGCLFLRDQ